MTRKVFIAGMFSAAALVIAAVAAPTSVRATEAVPAPLAQALDGQLVAFTMTAAKERRLMIIQNTNRNLNAARRGYGPRADYGPRRGYGPRPGYGRGDYDRPGYRRY